MSAALLALSMLLAQVVPCVPGDSTVVCKCKQGTPAACVELTKVDPELLKGILRMTAMAHAAQEAGKAKEAGRAEAQVIDSTGCGSGQDPNEKQECTGQWHHVISKAVWYALENHAVLKGKYTYRGPWSGPARGLVAGGVTCAGRLLAPAEVTGRLGVCRDSVYRMSDRGEPITVEP